LEKSAIAQRFDTVDRKMSELAQQSNGLDEQLSSLAQQNEVVDQKIADLKADQTKARTTIEKIAGKLPLILGGLVIIIAILGYLNFFQ
jgi:peptidoglycan hydrolase CwlO-like protein